MPVRQDFAGTAPPIARSPRPQPRDREPRTLVIVPAFNEAESLTRVLLELAACVPEATVLVVDDGSTDGTGDVARGAGAIVAQLERGGSSFAPNVVLVADENLKGELRDGVQQRLERWMEARIRSPIARSRPAARCTGDPTDR